MRLEGKVALITGAGSGIGRACAELFAREGACVAIAEIDSETGEAVYQSVLSEGGKAIFVKTDVSRPDSVEDAVKRTVDTFGGLDILYNNVGGSTLQDGSVATTSFEEFRRKIDIDLFGTWLGCHYAVPEMIKRGGGSIINASSINALRGTSGRAAYTAAKGAVTALTRSMAVDFAPHQIRVNAVAPGSTLTERIIKRRQGGNSRPQIAQRHILGLIDPIDIAYAVLYFASSESTKTTGQVLAVDSGFTVT
ncbi:Short-chain dehydrogenase/reductase SDR [Caballeronia calidae]|uniref:Short-chain dehydrogenase/reductase SDR n=1 Tax=Caballeronia calidae TaxID=1777139 RepID=A0A158A823_9BURK|nr:glucose 1-dehydrogenase [Caballeronia calidae]SAK53971.1 Short-chain dehydrogenase/reductase SDR [Caballeronia calidae]